MEFVVLVVHLNFLLEDRTSVKVVHLAVLIAVVQQPFARAVTLTLI